MYGTTFASKIQPTRESGKRRVLAMGLGNMGRLLDGRRTDAECSLPLSRAEMWVKIIILTIEHHSYRYE